MDEFEINSDIYVTRWYVLALPACHKGPAFHLQAELDSRIRHNETTFQYFAPNYTEVKVRSGKEVIKKRPLLYNYVFVYASEAEIRTMRRRLPLYNFLPRVHVDGKSHYPYVSEQTMQNLRWVAAAYDNQLPAYIPEPDKLIKGDRVRIIGGQFNGVEATIVTQPGVGEKEIVVCVDNWMWVPLLHVTSGQYEVISLSQEGKHAYTHLDNDRIWNGLHQAMQRRYTTGITEEDRRLARETLQLFGSLRMESDVMRCKLYSLLLQAYTLLDETELRSNLLTIVEALLPLVKAEQSRALLLVTLYGCTDNHRYYTQAHELVAPWQREARPKKSKQRLLTRLKEYDQWLKH